MCDGSLELRMHHGAVRLSGRESDQCLATFKRCVKLTDVWAVCNALRSLHIPLESVDLEEAVAEEWTEGCSQALTFDDFKAVVLACKRRCLTNEAADAHLTTTEELRRAMPGLAKAEERQAAAAVAAASVDGDDELPASPLSEAGVAPETGTLSSYVRVALQSVGLDDAHVDLDDLREDAAADPSPDETRPSPHASVDSLLRSASFVAHLGAVASANAAGGAGGGLSQTTLEVEAAKVPARVAFPKVAREPNPSGLFLTDEDFEQAIWSDNGCGGGGVNGSVVGSGVEGSSGDGTGESVCDDGTARSQRTKEYSSVASARGMSALLSSRKDSLALGSGRHAAAGQPRRRRDKASAAQASEVGSHTDDGDDDGGSATGSQDALPSPERSPQLQGAPPARQKSTLQLVQHDSGGGSGGAETPAACGKTRAPPACERWGRHDAAVHLSEGRRVAMRRAARVEGGGKATAGRVVGRSSWSVRLLSPGDHHVRVGLAAKRTLVYHSRREGDCDGGDDETAEILVDGAVVRRVPRLQGGDRLTFHADAQCGDVAVELNRKLVFTATRVALGDVRPVAHLLFPDDAVELLPCQRRRLPPHPRDRRAAASSEANTGATTASASASAASPSVPVPSHPARVVSRGGIIRVEGGPLQPLRTPAPLAQPVSDAAAAALDDDGGAYWCVDRWVASQRVGAAGPASAAAANEELLMRWTQTDNDLAPQMPPPPAATTPGAVSPAPTASHAPGSPRAEQCAQPRSKILVSAVPFKAALRICEMLDAEPSLDHALNAQKMEEIRVNVLGSPQSCVRPATGRSAARRNGPSPLRTAGRRGGGHRRLGHLSATDAVLARKLPASHPFFLTHPLGCTY